MGAFEDLTLQTFGRLKVEERTGTSSCGSALWQCWCLCGNTCIVPSGHLKSGHTTSCGCLSSRLTVGDLSRTHGDAPRGHQSLEYGIWAGMLRRCYNKNVRAYKDYGGRGITVCHRWHKFENFLADMGRRPGPGYSIERKKNELGYTACGRLLRSSLGTGAVHASSSTTGARCPSAS
jgi:hypothetical protein